VKYPICAYRMAKAHWHRWRFVRAWTTSGNAFMVEMVATMPSWPSLREQWREWLEAYDTARTK